MSSRRLPPLDAHKAAIIAKALENSNTPEPLAAGDISLDAILGKQLLALERVTRQLVLSASTGNMTKDEIYSLSTCIKITLELKGLEKDIIEDLSDEDLEKATK